MCVILDANCIGKYNKNPVDEDMKPVKHWIESKNGKIVILLQINLDVNG